MWTFAIAVLVVSLGSCTAAGTKNVLMIVADDGGFEMQVRQQDLAAKCLLSVYRMLQFDKTMKKAVIIMLL